MYFCLRKSGLIRTFTIAVSWGCFCLFSFHAAGNEALEQVTAKIEKYVESNPAIRLDVALIHRDEALLQSGFGSSRKGAFLPGRQWSRPA